MQGRETFNSRNEIPGTQDYKKIESVKEKAGTAELQLATLLGPAAISRAVRIVRVIE
jgi:hypothetical protein